MHFLNKLIVWINWIKDRFKLDYDERIQSIHSESTYKYGTKKVQLLKKKNNK